MSSTLIEHEWISKNIPYVRIQSPNAGPILIESGKDFGNKIVLNRFDSKEIMLSVFYGIFDSPLCGLRIRSLRFDSKDTYTVRNYMFGSSHVYDDENYVLVPPLMPPGLFAFKKSVDVSFQNWIELSLINTDNSSHYCLGYGYDLIHLL